MSSMNPKFHHTLTNLSHSISSLNKQDISVHFGASSNIYKHAHQIITGKIKWHQERQTMTCIFTLFMLQQFFFVLVSVFHAFYVIWLLLLLVTYNRYLWKFMIFIKSCRFDFSQTIQHKVLRPLKFPYIFI